jgi:hypothetical protein
LVERGGGTLVDVQGELFELAESDPAAYEPALEVIVRSANDPRILGMAVHLLYADYPSACPGDGTTPKEHDKANSGAA